MVYGGLEVSEDRRVLVEDDAIGLLDPSSSAFAMSQLGPSFGKLRTSSIGPRWPVERAIGVAKRARPLRGECDTIAHDMTHYNRAQLARTNVTLPAALLTEVDRFAGPRGRSRYVAEAVAQRVRRDALGAAIRETAGAMVGKPGWMSPDEVARWVDELRAEETE